ncbi:hypothetical protein [Clostridium weizhouense]|uniref:Uncharacterized protein n=1 Tax=Clostridium weizhouense TaxID=2859781 RepID=A0ABS7ANC1_9CLOT|nr:hypothetical protein [Clostridium weizhouense]MBW6408990.1 hypothetical protein [Clostridium weizhouense]
MINIKIDMLEIKKDRLKEIDLQIKKAVKRKDWNTVNRLNSEKKCLLIDIKFIEGAKNGR